MTDTSFVHCFCIACIWLNFCDMQCIFLSQYGVFHSIQHTGRLLLIVREITEYLGTSFMEIVTMYSMNVALSQQIKLHFVE